MEKKVVTRFELAKLAATRWKRQYEKYWMGETDAINKDVRLSDLCVDTLNKHAKLQALGAEPTPEAVDQIIGNHSWTTVVCAECDHAVDAAVQFSLAGANTTICLTCLERAVELLRLHQATCF